MKKLVVLLIVLSLAASVHAGLDISFSSNNGGYWSYTEDGVGQGTFSFVQPIGIDNVQGVHAGSLKDEFVQIPDLYVNGLSEVLGGSGIWRGTVTPLLDTTVTALDLSESDVFTGDLGIGDIIIVGTTASLYPVFGEDITNTLWSNGKGLGFELDFSLTLQGGIDIAQMIQDGESNTTGGSFSGSITKIPEPATFFILSLGSVLLLKNE